MAGELKKPFRKGLIEGCVTAKQNCFVTHFVRTGCNPTQAARYAGYADPKVSAYDLLRTPHIQAAIRFERTRVFDSELANLALMTLRNVLEDPVVPAGAKVMASRVVLEHVGLKEGEPSKGLQQLHQMSGVELTRELAQWSQNNL